MSELRKDPVIGRWVIVASERGKRPTDFAPAAPKGESVSCPFCAGNEGMTPPEIYAVRPPDTLANTPGWNIRVVPNKFPALRIEGTVDREGMGMFDKMSGIGAHEIIIETPRHDDLLHKRSTQSIVMLLDTYQKRIADLKRDIRLLYVMVFKNEGERAGASLSHPHSQIIATPIVPKRVREEVEGSLEYYRYKMRCVFCDIIREEKRFGSRLVYENASFISICPFASRFPFEIWVLPKRHMSDYIKMTQQEMLEFGECIDSTIKRLAIALGEPQYNWMLHTEPNSNVPRNPWPDISEHYHWHFEIIPKLTRVAGFEWGTGFYINPTPPEDAAEFLREVDIY
ncbi:galactose-1-phosphate uridylyltransferase [bacterium]|nr:galactose-1-phosphate uridylyltransferase [bacterium]